MKEPTSVKILKILYLISAIAFGILGVLLLTGGTALGLAIFGVGGIFVGGLGVVLLLLAGWQLVLFYGIKRRKNWVRILALIGASFSLIGFFTQGLQITIWSALTLIWNVFIIYSFGFDKKTIGWFK